MLEFMKDEGDDDMRQFATASFVEVINPESKKLVPLLLEMYKSKKNGSSGFAVGENLGEKS